MVSEDKSHWHWFSFKSVGQQFRQVFGKVHLYLLRMALREAVYKLTHSVFSFYSRDPCQTFQVFHNENPTWNRVLGPCKQCFRIRIGFSRIRIPGKIILVDPDTDPDHLKSKLLFINIDSKQPGLHTELSIPHIFSKMCHTLLSGSIFVLIRLINSLGFWLS